MNFDLEADEQAGIEMPIPSSTFLSESSRVAVDVATGSLSKLDDGKDPRRRVEGKDRLAVFYEPCPQGDDCAGDGKHRRLFDCEQGCGFRGCAACLDIHESEPHASDSETAQERFRDVQR